MSDEIHSWNDDRLDELNRRMDQGFGKVDRETKEGFARVDQRFERVDREMKEGFERVDQCFARVDQRFERVEQEMKEGFARVGERFATKEDMHRGFAEVKGELRHLNERFDRLLNVLVVISWGFAGTVLAALGGLLVVLL